MEQARSPGTQLAAGGDTEAFEPVQLAQPIPSSGDSHADERHVDDGDYPAYLQSVEEAAARSRNDPRASATQVAGAIPESRVPLRGGSERARERPERTVSQGGAPPRNRSRKHRGRPERQPDPRPLLRRPRVWFVIVAMIAAISALVVVLWTLNLVKATYDAYNEMNVPAIDRPVFEVNPEGTPVPVPTEVVAATLPDWENGDPFNILLLGVDNRDGEDDPIRSDTIIVVRVDPTNKSVTMMSIPRDLRVYIPEFRTDKINAAYPLGEFYEVPGGGVALAAQTIEANFDIRIHYFITVDFTGFRSIVDSIDGVIIDVPASVKDDQYPNETYGVTRVYFPTGLQHMDGATALRYVRTRHGDNDIARGERQQQVLLAIRRQALNLGLITRAESLIRETGNSVRTDLNFNQLLALANVGRQIESGSIIRINLWEEGLIYEHFPDDDDDAFYFDADWNGVWAIATEFFQTPDIDDDTTPAGDPSPTSGDDAVATNTAPSNETVNPPDFSVPVVVQNASLTDLIASTAAQSLVSAGFTDVTPENAIIVSQETVVYDYSGSPATAEFIAIRLGIDETHIVAGGDGIGIVVVLGDDYVPPSSP
ncbi:MAG TPA: LCP family protein [Thermomicrobiales bacterium]|nr:LCP family protein [Thermomicrobiales bacterium]